MKKTIIVFFSFVTLLSSAYGQNSDPRFDGVEKELEQLLELRDVAGYAVAVVEKDKVIYAKGFGYKDYENKIPVNTSTLFAIGSCTKAFTSAILGQLEDEGKLSLNDSPRKYVKNLNFYNEHLNSNVSIKDMMCHRTGLPRHDLSWYLFPSHSKDSLVARIAFQEPTAEIREVWQYNNFMFLAQGVIAENITGESWEENVKKRFFKPLGMNDSNLDIEAMKNAKDKSIGYNVEKEIITKMDYYDIAGMSPAGSINSSVMDMAKWVSCWINGGKHDGNQIIPIGYRNAAISSQMVVGPGTPDKENSDLHMGTYGYAWFNSSYRGHYRAEHGGAIDGFTASTSFFPSDSIGIIILVNQNGSSVTGTARNILADRALGLEHRIWDKGLNEKEEKDKEEEANADDVKSDKIENTVPSHNLKDYTGRYENPGYGSANVAMSNDSLFLNTTLDRYYLGHYHYDVFTPYEIEDDGSVDMSDDAFLKFNFSTSDMGEITSFSAMLEGGLDPIRFDKVPTVIDIDTEVLSKYVGEYEMGPMLAKVYTKGKGLFLFIEGQPEYTLDATGDNKFAIKGLKGFSLQFSGENDVISTVTFFQPNGTFKAKKKEK